MKSHIRLSAEQDAIADEVGRGRSEENDKAHRGDRASYDPKRIMSDNVLANQLAARAELGVCLYYGATWYGKVWPVSEHALHANEPDGEKDGKGIEVKWRRTGGWGVPVDKKDAELNHLIVWASVAPADDEYVTTVTIHGEAEASLLWENSKEDQRGDQRRRYADAAYLQSAMTYFNKD